MELLLNYLIRSGICLLILYLFYYTLLRRQPSFGFNRLYLLSSVPIALALPLFKWPASLTSEAAIAQGFRAVQLPEITITAAGQSATASAPLLSTPAFSFILLIVYLSGLGFLIFRLIRQLYSIRNLAATSTPVQDQESGVTILETPEHSPTFAFLSYIFISRHSYLTEAERKQVLEHEIAHVQLKHTADILYLEVLAALLWFNPVVWLLKNELRDVHEYQADARVASKDQLSKYSSLLAKEVLYKSGIPVGSYFKEPQVLKRLQMLNNYGKRSSWIRPAMVIPLFGALAFMFSSHQSSVTSNVAASPSLPTSKAEETLGKDQKEVTTEPEPKTIESGSQKVEAEVLEEKPFVYVEKMPRFEEGEVALHQFIADNIKYPESAIKDGKEGTVFLSFTVTKEGTLTDYKILKGLNKDTDAEALRVIKLTENNWIPGRQNGRIVPVKFTVPIRFVLNN